MPSHFTSQICHLPPCISSSTPLPPNKHMDFSTRISKSNSLADLLLPPSSGCSGTQNKPLGLPLDHLLSRLAESLGHSDLPPQQPVPQPLHWLPSRTVVTSASCWPAPPAPPSGGPFAMLGEAALVPPSPAYVLPMVLSTYRIKPRLLIQGPHSSQCGHSSD